MKMLVPFITLLTLFNISACQRGTDTKDEEIQREEEIDRDNVVEKRNMKTPSQLDLDRDVMDVDDFKLEK